MRAPDKIFGGYAFELDGTVYLGEELLPGAKETLATLKERPEAHSKKERGD